MSLSRKKLALAGGLLIVASGFVSIWIGARAGFMLYEPDPGGLFGHVGVWAGISWTSGSNCRCAACWNGWGAALLRFWNLARSEGREVVATVSLTRASSRQSQR